MRLRYFSLTSIYQSHGLTYIFLFFSGLISGFSFAPYYFLPAIFISFSILIYSFYKTYNHSTLWHQFFMGWFYGLGHFVAGLFWISNALKVFPDLHWVRPLAIVGIPALLAIFPGFTLLATSKVARLNKALAPIAFILFWSFFEWVRGSFYFTGFPWNLLGYIWGFSDEIIQITSLIGIYGLSLLTITFLSIPAYFIFQKKQSAFFFSSTIIVIIIAIYFIGDSRLNQANVTYHDDFTIKLIQPNISQLNKWDRTSRNQNFQLHTRLSETKHKKRVLILWSETASTFYLSHNVKKRKEIADILNSGQYVLTGGPKAEYNPEKPKDIIKRNSLYVIDHKGYVLTSYDKQHLVPFGEYIPYKFLFSWMPIIGDATGFTPGAGIRTIGFSEFPPFSPLICYEVIFSGKVANQKNVKPEWLLNVTNDAWYGDSPGPYQHYDMARFRAIEEGLPLVRIANTGISGVVDGYGRSLLKTKLNEQVVIETKLPKALQKPTFFSQYKNIPYYFCLFLLFMALLVKSKKNITFNK